MAQKVYYPDDFEAHKNLSHKRFPISVFYLMNGAVIQKQSTLSLSQLTEIKNFDANSFFS